MDNHSSHFSLELLESARGNNITILCLASKTTHVAQPLDRCLFAALKASYDRATAAARLIKPEHVLALTDFPNLFKAAFEDAATPRNITTGFRVTGIWPLDRTKVTDEGEKPSTVFNDGERMKCDAGGSRSSSSSSSEGSGDEGNSSGDDGKYY